MSAQHIDHLPLLSTQPPDSFENWQVRFARPVLLQTLSLRDPDLRVSRGAQQEGLNKRSLANARFARDEDHLTRPPVGEPQTAAEPLQLRPPSHEGGTRLVGGECPYYGCVPSKMIIRAANALAEAGRVAELSGSSSVAPAWEPVARRIRDEATDDWDDTVAVQRLEKAGVTFVRGH